ncbi:type II secretion system F family protein [Acetatifactor muris]|jgi:tight adherence protein B|uniref:Bacterial type II secretion system protein F domain protein n=1 Tax=Acetatifactor muris TaxID=879566 RepID=A0A2K4ZLI5_9FIRM|nr:type II secretion system F family protein [Acetatifactor muris]MCI8801020.1 hypothetical protein [Lachnospiraceae bacterium]MCR2049892.1 type II secretion system F family protein [Acetatifactor muris]SOY31305.1 Bacterial type II secretion system protein F domain protein [Acetatifactor muris]
METNLKRRDYHKYLWKKGEKFRTILICIGITGILAYFFYRSLWAMIPLSAVGILAFYQFGKEKAERAREELAIQFRECILSVAASLQAGYSVENAFIECRQDMVLMYGETALICDELDFIRRGLKINISLEELLMDMANRSDCEDIAQFAQIFSLAKRNGGNMSEIIRSSAGQIGKQIELRQEVQMLLGSKKMELTIMKVMPFGILFYINMGNPGYFDSLYHNLMGIGIMTGCLILYLGAYLMGEYIMKGIMAEMA